MVEMATQAANRFAFQSIALMPTWSSSQLIMPNSRPNSTANTIATAAVEVTFGISTAIRQVVRARSCRLSRLASQSAASSCGNVEITKMPSVLTTECQKSESASSWV